MDGTSPPRPAKPHALLIFAMGGEGGGVLTGWIVAAARAEGLAVQATSVPGVAQRTGGTTYYIEMAPYGPERRAPVFALTPVAGQIDVVLASELAEAARAAKLGYVTPERTAVIGSSHRVFTMPEKMAMGDGRLAPEGLELAAKARARRSEFADMAAIARACGVPISPVMLGALAGAGVMPITRASFETAIRDGGIAVERNLAAFATAFDAIAKPVRTAADFIAPDPIAAGPRVAGYPDATREVIARGLDRMTDYQSAVYAELYLKLLEPFRAGDPVLLCEVARQLALRMSYEDVIRVAQHKARAQRYERIRGELGVSGDEPFQVQDFFKPGVRELADIMPPAIGRFLLRRVEKGGFAARAHIGMTLRTTTILGYLRVWLLAKLRPWRPRSYRYAEEQAAIESWLTLVEAAVRRGASDVAREIVELARLVKGYGETHRRGTGNFTLIVDKLVKPALAAPSVPPDTAAHIRAARTAALADPEGKALETTLIRSAEPAA